LNEPIATSDALSLLVRELLLARTEGLEPAQLAAFVSGWTSVLELLARTDLTLSDAEPGVRDAVARVVDRIEHAQRDVLADDDPS
jgi:hypothetical protein